jgi:hypothetical protein
MIHRQSVECLKDEADAATAEVGYLDRPSRRRSDGPPDDALGDIERAVLRLPESAMLSKARP